MPAYDAVTETKPRAAAEPIPLSQEQERIWTAVRANRGGPRYNSVLVTLPANRESEQAAVTRLRELAGELDAFRVTLATDAGAPPIGVQRGPL